ncbi:MAG: hypothetical protein R3305_00285 [Gammaproteobacteria bacterium]|nr:hypothetical protein [Gammaproteobacteria bacterium]
MDGKAEVIALVLDDPIEESGAHKLIREADGRVTLEPVETEEEFERTARNTGCFRRGRPIRDPASFEIIGYEMEEIGLGAAAPYR